MGQQLMLRLIADFPSGSFAFVMATGIVSIAAALLGLGRLALILLAVNFIAYPLLWVLLLARLSCRPRAFIADLQDHQQGPSLLTVVAGTGVLGNQISLLTAHQGIAAALWLGAFVLWAAIFYCFFAAATVGAAKPPLDAGLDGNWLLTVVATEALAILATHVADAFTFPEVIVFASLCLFLLGGAIYVMIITLILYRWLFAPMLPEQLTPSYWINMGAAAIATLAGARLVLTVDAYPMLASTRGFIIGETVLWWSLASWWIPLLIGVMAWRHITGRVPLRYQFQYWSMVFPLGMYTAATWTFSEAIGAEFLRVVPQMFVWIALVAWCATFFGMMRHLFRVFRGNAATG
jgi:tellurite resistance protein TehA-like permease